MPFPSRSQLCSLLARLTLLSASLWLNPSLADSPGRVLLLADLQGQVWVRSTGDGGGSVSAVRARTIANGDRLSTESNAWAELTVGSTTLRLDGGADVEVIALNDDALRLQLRTGSMATRLRSPAAARGFELITTEGRTRTERPGHYRFDRVGETSHVTVWSGQALFEALDNAVTVMSGQRAELWRDERTEYSLIEPVHDAFGRWVAQRERAAERREVAHHGSPEIPEGEDLHRRGRWAWADCAPWGFTPMRDRRRLRVRNKWCWPPGC